MKMQGSINEMSPELRRALESVAKLRGKTLEEISELIDKHHYDPIGRVKNHRTPTDLLLKKEVVVDWKRTRYLPAQYDMANLSWMIYWMREEFKRLYLQEAERIEREFDNELLYGIHWKMRLPEIDHTYLHIP